MTKSLGRVLYLEFRRGNHTSQFIFAPEVVSPDDGRVVPFTTITRQISEHHPRRSWKFRANSAPSRTVDKATKSFVEVVSEDSLRVVLENLANTHIYLNSMASADWVLYKAPLVVELSADDVKDIQNVSTPNALIRRIVRARTEAGFEESFIEGVAA